MTKLILLVVLAIAMSGCEDQKLKRAKAEAALWKDEALQWERTANAWEAQAGRAVAAAVQAQAIADKCLREKNRKPVPANQTH